MTAVVIFRGTFNPITKTDINIVDKAIDFINSDETVPNATGVYRVLISPVHDKYPLKRLAPAKDRIAMIKLALDDSEHQDLIEVNLYESMLQDNYTPTYDVLCHLKKGYPDKDLFFLCDTDLLESMTRTEVWSDDSLVKIFDVCNLIAASRNRGENTNEPSEIFRKMQERPILIEARTTGKLYFLPDISLDSNSSYIRECCTDSSSTFTGFGLPEETDMPMKRLAKHVPFSIMAYIKKRNLFESIVSPGL